MSYDAGKGCQAHKARQAHKAHLANMIDVQQIAAVTRSHGV